MGRLEKLTTDFTSRLGGFLIYDRLATKKTDGTGGTAHPHPGTTRAGGGLGGGEGMSGNIHTTEQAAELTGIAAGTIRQWKTRKSDILIEAEHWLLQDGSLFWTDAGIEQLAAIKGKKTVSPRNTNTVSQRNTSAVSDGDTDYFEPLLDAIAEQLTPSLVQRLTGKITRRLGDTLSRPMARATVSQHIEELSAIGILPIGDPVAALTGSSSGYLLEASEDED